MNLAFLTPSVSRQAGGMLDCVRRPAQELRKTHAIRLNVFAPADAASTEDLPLWDPLPVQLFPTSGPKSFGYTPEMAASLAGFNADLVHTHGLWVYLSVVAHRWHKRTKRPYIITPHGMLDPWALNNARGKKRVASVLYERRHLRDAACLHGFTTAEVESFRAYGLDNPACIIPNGVDLPSEDARAMPPPWSGKLEKGRKVLLYLGRIHPKKGLPQLLRAWADVRNTMPTFIKDWCLAIVGWDQAGHESELKRLATDLKLEDAVLFLGPQFGAAKAAAYANADAFALPSLSEGLPLVVLEAWANYLPVILTPACNLQEGVEAGAAFCADPESKSLASALSNLCNTSDEERAEMGKRGRALVEAKFSWLQCAAQLRAVYAWILDSGPRPDCIIV